MARTERNDTVAGTESSPDGARSGASARATGSHSSNATPSGRSVAGAPSCRRTTAAVGVVVTTVATPSGTSVTEDVTQIVPAPGRARIAVVESHRLTTFAAVSVVDFEGEAPRRLWTRAFAPERVDLSWSEDGSRVAIAVESDGGHILDGASGETIFERRHRDFATEAISRDPAARSGSARSSG